MRPKPTRAGMFSPAIHLAGPVKNSRITHNIIHVNRKPMENIDRTMVTLDSWGGYPDSTFFDGNIFYTPEVSRFTTTESTHNFFRGNYYLGKFKNLPEDSEMRQASDIYRDKVVSVDENGYRGLALLMDTLEVAGTKGVFVNKEKVKTFLLLGR